MFRTAPRPHDHDETSEPGGPVASALALAARRPADTLAGVLAAACTVMILANAVALQRGRVVQPTPIPRADATPAQTQARKAEPDSADLVSQVQTALAERDFYDGVVDGALGAGTIAAIRAFEQSQGMALTGEPSEKVLAALLTAPMRKVDAAPKQPQKPAVQTAGALTTGSTAVQNPRLMATQKALAKLGYGPVAVDGKMGAGTRAAIKSFERDRGLPETGDLSPQTLKALQAQAGTSFP